MFSPISSVKKISEEDAREFFEEIMTGIVQRCMNSAEE